MVASSNTNAWQQIDFIDKPNHRHIDRRLRTAHRGHGAEAFGREQDAVAYAGVYRIHGDYGVPAIAAIQVEWLDQQQFAADVTGMFLRRPRRTVGWSLSRAVGLSSKEDSHFPARRREFRCATTSRRAPSS